MEPLFDQKNEGAEEERMSQNKGQGRRSWRCELVIQIVMIATIWYGRIDSLLQDGLTVRRVTRVKRI